VEALDEGIVSQHVGQGHERHALVMREEGAHDGRLCSSTGTGVGRRDERAIVHRLVEAELAVANRAAVDLMVALRDVHESDRTPIVISANIGPRGDGYKIENAMTVAEAEDYHGWQVSIFRDTEADLVSAFTINYVEEGIGVARACRKAAVRDLVHGRD
jgi:hypothetical protein